MLGNNNFVLFYLLKLNVFFFSKDKVSKFTKILYPDFLIVYLSCKIS